MLLERSTSNRIESLVRTGKQYRMRTTRPNVQDAQMCLQDLAGQAGWQVGTFMHKVKTCMAEL